LCIGGLEYCYRISTQTLYPKKKDRGNTKSYFDMFVVDDPRFFDQHFAKENFFRETVLLRFLSNPRIQNVGLFGQLPGGIVYRQIDEKRGVTFAEHLKTRMKSFTDQVPRNHASLESQKTLFTEFEVIGITLKIINLVEELHSRGIVHTNLAPESIFMLDGDIDQMCFLNLYHASWNPKQLLKGSPMETGISGLEDNPSLYDCRTRN
jgi:hypothetical protein